MGWGVRYGSVCSGIEAATVAWEQLGWSASWLSEIEKFPSKVLEHHYPDISNLGDMTKIADMVKNKEVEAPDILVGGTPCQAFSVAGLRNSLNDDRGQLSLEFVRLANEIDSTRLIQGLKPTIILWENVPGVLNTKDNAFGCFLGALSGSGCELQPTGSKWSNAGCVFGPQRQVAWRILDAQYFGLAQRRKRVFVIASARAECVAEILFERKGLSGDIEKGKSKKQGITKSGRKNLNRTSGTVSGKSITPPLLASHGQKMWLGNQEAFCGDYYIKHAIGVGGCNSNAAITVEKSATLLGNNDPSYVIHGTQDPIASANTAHCLVRNNGQENVLCEPAYAMIADTTPKISKEINGTLRSSGGGGIVPSSVVYQYVARYLTEVEAERLQGFPDNYTDIPGATKGHRYKALGNSMAVPVMAWIGKRIQDLFEVVA